MPLGSEDQGGKAEWGMISQDFLKIPAFSNTF